MRGNQVNQRVNTSDEGVAPSGFASGGGDASPYKNIMTEQEALLRQLCVEIALRGVHTDRFTELWLASGLKLEDEELAIAQKYLGCKSDVYWPSNDGPCH